MDAYPFSIRPGWGRNRGHWLFDHPELAEEIVRHTRTLPGIAGAMAAQWGGLVRLDVAA